MKLEIIQKTNNILYIGKLDLISIINNISKHNLNL
jgi:hypothetical protein